MHSSIVVDNCHITESVVCRQKAAITNNHINGSLWNAAAHELSQAVAQMSKYDGYFELQNVLMHVNQRLNSGSFLQRIRLLVEKKRLESALEIALHEWPTSYSFN